MYETDGELAIGIHETSAVRLLPPLGIPPSIRILEQHRTSTGELFPSYRYANPSAPVGPNGVAEVIGNPASLDFTAHVAFVVSDQGALLDRQESPSFVLGYCLVMFLCDADMVQTEKTLGIGTARSHDFGTSIGPYLTTPEDLAEFSTTSDPAALIWNYAMKVNDKIIASATLEPWETAPEALTFLSTNRSLAAGDVVAFSPLDKPTVESVLGRPLMGGDRIEVSVQGLGALVVHVG